MRQTKDVVAFPNIPDVIILTFLFTTASKYIYPRVDEAIHEADNAPFRRRRGRAEIVIADNPEPAGSDNGMREKGSVFCG